MLKEPLASSESQPGRRNFEDGSREPQPYSPNSLTGFKGHVDTHQKPLRHKCMSNGTCRMEEWRLMAPAVDEHLVG
jgi:hypothetical protein